MILRVTLTALLVFGATVGVAAQEKISINDCRCEPQTISLKKPNGSAETTKRAGETQYAYDFAQSEFYIRHIKIEHGTTGRGKISFERKGLDDPIIENFELSQTARERITALWDALGFIDSTASYQSEKQFPHLGTVHLTMKREGRERTAEFNWTNDPNAFALINEYRRAADQAIFVFDINLAREHQPLEAPKLLDQLDSMLKRNGLSDPQQLLALLRDLNTDERIPLIARNHAARLVKKIEGKHGA
ncbi:MAG: hypothetical protein ABR577_07520 [Pyrinomonadaceae bacterium]